MVIDAMENLSALTLPMRTYLFSSKRPYLTQRLTAGAVRITIAFCQY